MNTFLNNGALWLDTNGNPIHAHGGYIIQHDGFFYWYGENRLDNIYISCYRSTDLLNWEFRNNIITTESKTEHIRIRTDIKLTNDGKKVNLERPKVLYNSLTNKFVLWVHYENGKDYSSAGCAIATCDTPDGDFIYHGAFNPYGYMSRDCTLFLDDDGSAYFISAARDNADLHVYRLTADFMNVDKLVNILWQGEYREAPAVFKYDGVYYMLSSFCTGWDPNQGKYARGTAIDGDWEILELFGDKTTFDTQPAFVLPYNGQFLYFSDRWGGGGDAYFTSSYVVLPIQFNDNGTIFIEYNDTFKA
jgi:Beta-xylosidase